MEVQELRVTLGRQRQILASTAKTIEDAERAFDETQRRLESYDARLAHVEAVRAKRLRWRLQVAYLKSLEKPEIDHEAVAKDVLRAQRAIEKARMGFVPKWEWLTAAREEAAGWLFIEGRRRWFAARQHEKLGPFVDWSASPGTPLLGRLILQGCEVTKTDSESMFSFVVTHPLQSPMRLSSVNAQTRKQWISVLSQLVRDHALEERGRLAVLRERDTPPALINDHLAKTRLLILEARDQADYGHYDEV